MANPTITIKFENGKEIKAELYPERAPFNVQFLLDGIETVALFAELALRIRVSISAIGSLRFIDSSYSSR